MSEQVPSTNLAEMNKSRKRHLSKGVTSFALGAFGLCAGISPALYGVANMFLFPDQTIPYIEFGGGVTSIVLGVGAVAIGNRQLNNMSDIEAQIAKSLGTNPEPQTA